MYIFHDVLKRYFPNSPPATVRGRLWRNGQSLHRVNDIERLWLHKRGLHHRFLISDVTLQKILEHSKTIRRYKRKVRTVSSSVSEAVNSTKVSTFAPRVNPMSVDSHESEKQRVGLTKHAHFRQ